jgi:hypothetical protein
MTPVPPAVIDRLPAVVNLRLYQGDDFYLDVTVTDADGNPADLSSYTARAQVRSSPPNGTNPPMATFTATIAGNVVHLHLPASEAVNLANPACWDCEIDGDDLTTLVYGGVRVSSQVTQ